MTEPRAWDESLAAGSVEVGQRRGVHAGVQVLPGRW
jgi:hypothetical protein